jgi:uncharacterized protein YggE
MKTAFLFLSLLLLQITGVAQQTSAAPSILVTGIGKKEIVPDEIYVRVGLKEFIRDHSCPK